MKTMNTKILFFLALFCSLQLNLFTADLNSIRFVNAETGYVSGSEGTLLKTTDAGETWTQLTFPNSSYIYDFTILGESSLLTVSESGVHLTVDGGETWEPKQDGLTGTFRSIVFTYDARLYICGPNSNLFVSEDFGNSWTKINVEISSNFNRIYFFDQNLGYIVGSNGVLMVTTDAGLQWDVKLAGQTRLNLTSIAMCSDKIGILIGEGGYIARTVTGWSTYKIILPPTDRADLLDIKYIVPGTAVISGANFILKSTDDGSSWNNVSTPNLNYEVKFNSICFPTPTKGFIAGSTGTILFSTNNGTSWNSIKLQNKQDINYADTKLTNFPNPFNPSTVISYEVPFDGYVSIKIYDITGKEVAALFESNKTAGNYTISFNASNLSSGIYFYKLTAENKQNSITKTNRMLLVK